MFSASGPVVASKTLDAINVALQRDRGNLFRRYLRETIPLAEDAYREDTDPFRTHLGASLIGRDCTRELFYTFRWATHPDYIPEFHDGQCSGPPAQNCPACVERRGRMQRLYNRGHLEEARFVALLKMIGCEVWQHDSAGKQFRVSYHDGHYGGSLDSVLRGCPDDPSQPLLGEFKTHKADSFKKLWKEGVRSSKFPHFVQMQTYMGGYQLRRALYLAVNKDTDDLYAELVDFDPEQFAKYLERAKIIIGVNPAEPPKKLGESPGWFSCKFCDQRLVCHGGVPPHRNCRTCIHSRPGEGGIWYCTHPENDWAYGDNPPLDKSAQLAACPKYDRAF